MSKEIEKAVILVTGFFVILGTAIGMATLIAYDRTGLAAEAQTITPPGANGWLLNPRQAPRMPTAHPTTG
jgi:hypothetical protein